MLFENFFIKIKNHFKMISAVFISFLLNPPSCLKLEGYYYDLDKKCFILITKIKNKRIFEKLPLQDAINNKGFLKLINPFDACTIGILANLERNNLIDKKLDSWRKMERLKSRNYFIQPTPLLFIKSKYLSQSGIKTVTLFSKHTKKEMEISLLELYKKPYLLYAMDSFQTVALGYDIGDALIAEVDAPEDSP